MYYTKMGSLVSVSDPESDDMLITSMFENLFLLRTKSLKIAAG